MRRVPHRYWWRNPRWNFAERRWTSDAPTTSPLRLEQRAWTRTALIDPGAHMLRLTVRLEPDRAPVTMAASYVVERETFCAIEVRVDRQSISVSECAAIASLLGDMPD